MPQHMILVGDGAVFSYTAALLSPEQQYFHPGAGTHSANLQIDRYVPSRELYLINTGPPRKPGLLKTKGCLNHSIEYGIMLFVAARLKFQNCAS